MDRDAEVALMVLAQLDEMISSTQRSELGQDLGPYFLQSSFVEHIGVESLSELAPTLM